MKHRVRDERGGALVEFALIVPLLLVLLIGIFDMARAWHTYQVITDAAREGARRAVVFDGQNKVGTQQAPGTVPSAILSRMANARLNFSGAWNPANYTPSCEGWNPPAPDINRPITIYGCGWGRANNTETTDYARVVIHAPHPFAFLGPLVGMVGGSMNATVLQSNYVMRNE